jgi:hypothetical protein
MGFYFVCQLVIFYIYAISFFPAVKLHVFGYWIFLWFIELNIIKLKIIVIKLLALLFMSNKIIGKNYPLSFILVNGYINRLNPIFYLYVISFFPAVKLHVFGYWTFIWFKDHILYNKVWKDNRTYWDTCQYWWKRQLKTCKSLNGIFNIVLNWTLLY